MWHVALRVVWHAFKCRTLDFTVIGQMDNLLLFNCNKCHTTLSAKIGIMPCSEHGMAWHERD